MISFVSQRLDRIHPRRADGGHHSADEAHCRQDGCGCEQRGPGDAHDDVVFRVFVAVGNDPEVSNRSAAILTTVISPSILLDEVEVRPADAQNEKLPEYPPPGLTEKKRP